MVDVTVITTRFESAADAAENCTAGGAQVLPLDRLSGNAATSTDDVVSSVKGTEALTASNSAMASTNVAVSKLTVAFTTRVYCACGLPTLRKSSRVGTGVDNRTRCVVAVINDWLVRSADSSAAANTSLTVVTVLLSSASPSLWTTRQHVTLMFSVEGSESWNEDSTGGSAVTCTRPTSPGNRTGVSTTTTNLAALLLLWITTGEPARFTTLSVYVMGLSSGDMVSVALAGNSSTSST